MRYLVLWAWALWIVGCGVKGDPLPPEKPAELGRGRPTYRRAMKDVRVAPVIDEEFDEEEEE